MNQEGHCCCCGDSAANPEEANRSALCRFAVAFRWVARGAALYFLLLLVAQWIMFFSAPSAPGMDYRWGLLSSAAYLVLGALSWAVFTAFSMALERLLMIPVKPADATEAK